MAVESTPERSFSDLFSSSRAAEATTGCGRSPEMRRRHHGAQRRLDRPPGIGQKVRDAGERLVGLGVEDVEDRADQQRMAGLLPMIAPFERAFRDRPGCRRRSGRRVPRCRRGGPRATDCRRRSRGLVGSNSSTRPKRARQPAVSCQFSPLMSWTIAEPGQVSSVGITRPTPLPRARRREAQHVLRSVVAQIVSRRSLPSTTPSGPRRPAPCELLGVVAQRAEP